MAGECSEEALTAKEFAIYFLGLEEDGTVTLEELSEELPYSEEIIVERLENLKQQNYIDSVYEESLKPTKTQGFEEKLYNVRQETVEEERYWLTDEGREYIEEMELEGIKESLEYVFSLD